MNPPITLYKIVYTVPASHLDVTKSAVFATGAGRYHSNSDATYYSPHPPLPTMNAAKPAGPLYERVSLETATIGVFTPGPESDPHIGKRGVEERVEEIRVEIRCAPGEEGAKEAVKALKRIHPYEVVGYEVYKVENF